MTRAERRRRKELTRARMMRAIRTWSGGYSRGWAIAWARKAAENPQMCSGMCCGNQRRWYGPSISELRRIGDGT